MTSLLWKTSVTDTSKPLGCRTVSLCDWSTKGIYAANSLSALTFKEHHLHRFHAKHLLSQPFTPAQTSLGLSVPHWMISSFFSRDAFIPQMTKTAYRCQTQSTCGTTKISNLKKSNEWLVDFTDIHMQRRTNSSARKVVKVLGLRGPPCPTRSPNQVPEPPLLGEVLQHGYVEVNELCKHIL